MDEEPGQRVSLIPAPSPPRKPSDEEPGRRFSLTPAPSPPRNPNDEEPGRRVSPIPAHPPPRNPNDAAPGRRVSPIPAPHEFSEHTRAAMRCIVYAFFICSFCAIELCLIPQSSSARSGVLAAAGISFFAACPRIGFYCPVGRIGLSYCRRDAYGETQNP